MFCDCIRKNEGVFTFPVGHQSTPQIEYTVIIFTSLKSIKQVLYLIGSFLNGIADVPAGAASAELTERTVGTVSQTQNLSSIPVQERTVGEQFGVCFQPTGNRLGYVTCIADALVQVI